MKKVYVMLCLLLFSSSLYAVDGVVLIGQNSALAGNVTPGDTAGFPVTISLPGSYRLSGNLTVPDFGSAILITAEHVTLDLNGFSIIGPVTCTPNPTNCSSFGAGGIGVQAPPYTLSSIGALPAGPRGIRVLNGTVRDFSNGGIRMSGDGVIVERVVAYGNGNHGINVPAGGVIDSVASLNKGVGIVANIVHRSIANMNANAGILVLDGVVTGSTARFNGTEGISMDSSTATDNAVSFNKTFGIEATCPSTIVGNTAHSNRAGNIQAQGACTLANNTQ